MAVENDEIDVPEEAKNSLEVTPKLAEAFPEAITLSEALNCRICRSHIKTPMLTKCKTLFLRASVAQRASRYLNFFRSSRNHLTSNKF